MPFRKQENAKTSSDSGTHLDVMTCQKTAKGGVGHEESPLPLAGPQGTAIPMAGRGRWLLASFTIQLCSSSTLSLPFDLPHCRYPYSCLSFLYCFDLSSTQNSSILQLTEAITASADHIYKDVTVALQSTRVLVPLKSPQAVKRYSGGKSDKWKV